MRRGDDAGSAVLELLGVALLLLVPLVYLVLVLARLEAATFAVEGAARDAARTFAAADDARAGTVRAVAATGIALRDAGLGDDPAAALALACPSGPCLAPGGTVTARVAVRVPLPFVPAAVRGAVPLEVPVSAERSAGVDRFRSTAAAP
nr:pilus assembly protein TadE [Cellulomonas marina]